NYGVEITAERFLTKGFYGLVTASLFQSEYKTKKDVWYNTQFNNKYVFNALAGKEFTLKDNGKSTRIVGVNGKISYLGAIRHHKVLLQESIEAGNTRVDLNEPY